MRTLFTPHAGEVLVGAEIEHQIKGADVWLPAKDQGIDLFVTNSGRTRAVGLQVKFSRDFSQGGDLVAGGWWKFDRQKIRTSRADLWVFALVPMDRRKTWYVLIPPDDLEKRISEIHGKVSPVHLYLNVTKHQRCLELRDLSKAESQTLAARPDGDDGPRDFTRYLNAWPELKQRLS